jgi:hypothetical protein
MHSINFCSIGTALFQDWNDCQQKKVQLEAFYGSNDYLFTKLV